MEQIKPAWQPVVSTPEDCPVTVFDGILTYPGSGGQSLMYSSFVNNSWGSEGGSRTTISSPFAPDGVGVKWYSFIDDKFYSGFCDLPYDTIKALFDKGVVYADNKKRGNYDYIIVGLAPGGVVSVWIDASGTTIEVANFKAREVDLNLIEEIPPGMRDYYIGYTKDSARAEWRESLLKRLPHIQEFIDSGKSVPAGLWDKKFREKFDSRVRVNYADTSAILDMTVMRFLNGEQETLMYEAMKENAFAKRPRFKDIKFMWSFGRTLREANIELDQREVLEAYDKIYAGQDPAMQVELRVDVNKENNFIRVFLQAVGTEYPREVEFEKSYIEIYPIRESLRFLYDVFSDEYEYVHGGGIPLRKDRKKQ